MKSTPTETEKRVLIAEACGFERQHPIEGVPVWKKPGHPLSPVECLPDYFTSLDAIHEAEKALNTYDKKEAYSRSLYDVNTTAIITVSYEGEHDYEGYFSLLHSTAAQRAEAFGITLGLWPKPPSAP